VSDETAEIPTLELRADEPEAVAIARKGAFFYRARHGRDGEKRARQLDEFADAAFEWQHADPGHSAVLAPAELEEEQAEELAELEEGGGS